MKLVKLSLATMIALSTSVFGADTLEDAFKNGKINGELRAFYFDRSYGNGSTQVDADILNLAVRMSYETDEFKGFRLGASFQSNHAPWADEDAKINYLPSYDMYGSGAVLSEAYLSYAIDKTTIKIGRQYLNMPLMRSDGSRIIIQAVEGVSVVSKAIEDTTLYGAYIWRMQDRTDGAGGAPDFEKVGWGNGDYAYVIGAENTSIDNLKLTLAYGEEDESHSMLLAQADYTRMVDGINYVGGIQYIQTDEDGNKNPIADDATVYGAKLGAGYGGFNAYVAYSEIDDGTGSFGIAMTDDKPMLYTSAFLEAGLYGESEQYAIDANYMISQVGLLVGARYVNVDYTGSEEVDYSGIYGVYNFEGALKGLSTVAMYEKQDSNVEANDKDEFRVRVIYAF